MTFYNISRRDQGPFAYLEKARLTDELDTLSEKVQACSEKWVVPFADRQELVGRAKNIATNMHRYFQIGDLEEAITVAQEAIKILRNVNLIGKPQQFLFRASYNELAEEVNAIGRTIRLFSDALRVGILPEQAQISFPTKVINWVFNNTSVLNRLELFGLKPKTFDRPLRTVIYTALDLKALFASATTREQKQALFYEMQARDVLLAFNANTTAAYARTMPFTEFEGLSTRTCYSSYPRKEMGSVWDFQGVSAFYPEEPSYSTQPQQRVFRAPTRNGVLREYMPGSIPLCVESLPFDPNELYFPYQEQRPLSSFFNADAPDLELGRTLFSIWKSQDVVIECRDPHALGLYRRTSLSLLTEREFLTILKYEASKLEEIHLVFPQAYLSIHDLLLRDVLIQENGQLKVNAAPLLQNGFTTSAEGKIRPYMIDAKGNEGRYTVEFTATPLIRRSQKPDMFLDPGHSGMILRTPGGEVYSVGLGRTIDSLGDDPRLSSWILRKCSQVETTTSSKLVKYCVGTVAWALDFLSVPEKRDGNVILSPDPALLFTPRTLPMYSACYEFSSAEAFRTFVDWLDVQRIHSENPQMSNQDAVSPVLLKDYDMLYNSCAHFAMDAFEKAKSLGITCLPHKSQEIPLSQRAIFALQRSLVHPVLFVRDLLVSPSDVFAWSKRLALPVDIIAAT